MRDLSERVLEAIRRREVAAPVVLCVLFPLWGTHGRAPFDLAGLLGLGGDPFAGPMLDFAWGALLMVGVPLLVVRLWLREPVRSYGLGLGDVRLGWKVAVIGLAIGLPAMWMASRDPAMREVYPRFGQPDGGVPVDRFVVYSLAYGLFFLAGEFSMRGFLLFALEERSAAMAVAVTALVQTVWHLGTPVGELASAPVWGVVVGALNLRLRSIWYLFAVHWGTNVWLDAMIVYG